MGLWQDVQFASRLLVKDKGFTLVAVIALSLGIGVNATVFTFVNAVLLRSLPFENPDQIMAINSADLVRNRPNMGVSYLDYRDWADGSRSFSALGAGTGQTMNVSDEGRLPERYSGAFVSANMFTMLGQAPAIGRNFVPDDDRPGAPAVVLIGSTVFKNRYGSDPSIVGRTIRINEVPSTVIGVMPEGFRFPSNSDLWQPLAADRDIAQQKRNERGFQVIARLASGVTPEQSQAEMDAIAKRLAAEYPDTNKDIQARVRPYNEIVNGPQIRGVFLSLMGAVVFVLLIACANVANLLLARATHRGREIAVRVSIGASRRRIVRQLLVESLLVAVIAGVIGFALSLVGIRLFDAATQDVGRPYWIQFTLDTTVFAFLAGVCLLTAVAFGLAPALHIARTDVNEILKEGGRSGSGGHRARVWSNVLVVGEIALTLALLAGAAFMMRNFLTMYQLDVGVDTSRLITMQLMLPDAKYPALEQRLDFYRRVQERLGSRFEAVSMATSGPMQGGLGRRFEIVGKPKAPEQELPTVTMVGVDPRYFGTVGVDPLGGRTFTDADGLGGQHTAIVNARLSQMYFPNEDPLGQQIVLSVDSSMGQTPPGIPMSQTVTIVGVTPNIRQNGGDDPDPAPVAYVPFTMQPRGAITLIARASGDPNQLTPVIREEMRAIDADLPLYNIRTLDDTLARNRWPFRVFGSMFAFFALVALILSAVGLYSVTAYAVTQRTQEIGIRTALGAQSRDVMSLFARQALVCMGVGLALGIGAAVGVGAVFESAGLLVQVDGQDPVTIGAIAVVMMIVAVVAATWPARKATKLDPLVALRGD